MAATAASRKVTVGKWRRSFTSSGLDGLEDATVLVAHPNTTPRSGRGFSNAFVSRPNLTAVGPCGRRPENLSWLRAPCMRSWLRRIFNRTGSGPLPSAPILTSKPSSLTSSVFTWIPPTRHWFFVWTKKRAFRPWT